MNPNELELESDVPSIENIEVEEQENRFCLQCGTELTGNFCHNCGQSASTPKRINGRNFWKTFIKSVTDFESGFLYTLWLLFTRPWILIRDYTNGQRKKYVNPFKFLLQIIVIISVLNIVLEHLGFISGIQEYVKKDIHWIFVNLFNNVFVRDILVVFAESFSMWIVFTKIGKFRYNIFEYFFASCYMMVISFLLFMCCQYSGLKLLDDNTSIPFLAIIIMTILICYYYGVSLYMAFKRRSWWKWIGLTIGFLILFVISLGVFNALMETFAQEGNLMDNMIEYFTEFD